jgi:hypothetical protein
LVWRLVSWFYPGKNQRCLFFNPRWFVQTIYYIYYCHKLSSTLFLINTALWLDETHAQMFYDPGLPKFVNLIPANVLVTTLKVACRRSQWFSVSTTVSSAVNQSIENCNLSWKPLISNHHPCTEHLKVKLYNIFHVARPSVVKLSGFLKTRCTVLYKIREKKQLFVMKQNYLLAYHYNVKWLYFDS